MITADKDWNKGCGTMKTDHQLINQDSGNVEMYTDLRIVEAARTVMGVIDLDPASSELANKRVKATAIYTKEDSAFNWYWYGRVWMNHPFYRGWAACTDTCDRVTCETRGYHVYEDIPSNGDWIDKLINEHAAGRVTESCNITFGSTSEKWFQKLAMFPQCFISPRLNYFKPSGEKVKGVTKGSVVTYMGPNIELFDHVFSEFGVVK